MATRASSPGFGRVVFCFVNGTDPDLGRDRDNNVKWSFHLVMYTLLFEIDKLVIGDPGWPFEALGKSEAARGVGNPPPAHPPTGVYCFGDGFGRDGAGTLTPITRE